MDMSSDDPERRKENTLENMPLMERPIEPAGIGILTIVASNWRRDSVSLFIKLLSAFDRQQNKPSTSKACECCLKMAATLQNTCGRVPCSIDVKQPTILPRSWTNFTTRLFDGQFWNVQIEIRMCSNWLIVDIHFNLPIDLKCM